MNRPKYLELEFQGSMLSGISPRSAQTSRVHRLFRDGYADEKQFLEAIGRDADALTSEQSNFAYSSYGQLDWLDIFRPIARSFSGFASRASAGEDSVGPVTRWFRTNTFYRKPLVNGKITCNGEELARVVPNSSKPAVIFLPAPYSLSRMVENSFYGSVGDLAVDYSKALSKSIPALLKRGYKCMLLLDHMVGYEQSKGTFKVPDWYANALSGIKSHGMRVGVHYPSSSARKVVPLADSSSIDMIGIDAVFDAEVKMDTGKDVLVGVIDSTRVGIESEKEVVSILRKVLEKSSFSGRFYIGPRDRLYDVPFETALQKIRVLSRINGI